MKYIEDLKKELSKANFSSTEIEEIIEDFSEMIEEAISSGLSEEELESKFGSPEKIATELHRENHEEVDSDEEEEEVSNEGKNLEFIPGDGYKISIGLINEDINIKVEDVDKIYVKPVHVRKLNSYQIDFKDNTFILKKQSRKSFGWFGSINNDGGTFNITLPQNKNVKDMEFSIVNGDGSIIGMTVEKMKFRTTNGDFSLANLELKEASIESINGDIKLSDINSDQLKLSFVSGDAEFERINIKGELNLNTVSGEVKVEELSCKRALIKTVSGDVDGKEFYTDEVVLRSISGDVHIENKDPNRKIANVKKSSISGEVVIKQ
jgi:DUF4097 and DUF4098 domain-containing protein YvlB